MSSNQEPYASKKNVPEETRISSTSWNFQDSESLQHKSKTRNFIERFFRSGVKRSYEERRFTKKLDLHLLLWGCIAYILKSIDQTNVLNAYVSGMKEDLNIVGNSYSWILTFFLIGYLIGILPSQFFLQKIKTQYWVPSCEFVWGVLTMCCAFVDSNRNSGQGPVKTLYALRFLIGLLESSSWPAMMTIFHNYYDKYEYATRAALFTGSYHAGTMFTGFLQAAIHKNLDGVSGVAGWKWLFIINGIMTMFWASIGVYFIPSPVENGGARWMNSQDLAVAQEKLDRMGRISKHQFNFKKVIQVFTDYRFYLLLLAYVPELWTNGETYFNLWLKSLKNSDGTQQFSIEQINLIPIAGAAIQMVNIIVLSKFADNTGYKLPVMIFECCVGFTGTVILATWPKQEGVKFFAFFLLYAKSANVPILTSFIGEIWDKAPEVRAIVTGSLVLMVYANNAWISLYVWPSSEAPVYRYGYKVTAGFISASFIGIVFFYCIGYKRTMQRQNQSIIVE